MKVSFKYVWAEESWRDLTLIACVLSVYVFVIEILFLCSIPLDFGVFFGLSYWAIILGGVFRGLCELLKGIPDRKPKPRLMSVLEEFEQEFLGEEEFIKVGRHEKEGSRIKDQQRRKEVS